LVFSLIFLLFFCLLWYLTRGVVPFKAHLNFFLSFLFIFGQSHLSRRIEVRFKGRCRFFLSGGR
jgi:hypothetical protein